MKKMLFLIVIIVSLISCKSDDDKVTDPHYCSGELESDREFQDRIINILQGTWRSNAGDEIVFSGNVVSLKNSSNDIHDFTGLSITCLNQLNYFCRMDKVLPDVTENRSIVEVEAETFTETSANFVVNLNGFVQGVYTKD